MNLVLIPPENPLLLVDDFTNVECSIFLNEGYEPAGGFTSVFKKGVDVITSENKKYFFDKNSDYFYMIFKSKGFKTTNFFGIQEVVKQPFLYSEDSSFFLHITSASYREETTRTIYNYISLPISFLEVKNYKYNKKKLTIVFKNKVVINLLKKEYYNIFDEGEGVKEKIELKQIKIEGGDIEKFIQVFEERKKNKNK